MKLGSLGPIQSLFNEDDVSNGHTPTVKALREKKTQT